MDTVMVYKVADSYIERGGRRGWYAPGSTFIGIVANSPIPMEDLTFMVLRW